MTDTFMHDTVRGKIAEERSFALDVTALSRRGKAKKWWRHELLGSQIYWKNDIDKRSSLFSSEDNYRLNGYKINR